MGKIFNNDVPVKKDNRTRCVVEVYYASFRERMEDVLFVGTYEECEDFFFTKYSPNKDYPGAYALVK